MSETTEDTRVEQYPHLKRNFTLGVINGGLFVFAEALMSIDTVLPWFVQQLSGSNFLIGLVGPMRDAGWFLPQLFTSHRLQREPLKMPLYRRAAAVRAVVWFIWTAATFLLAANYPALILIFFVAYAINSLASGFAGLPFMDIVAKAIPPDRRGSFFGGRLFSGGVLALIASVVVGVALSTQNPQPFPINVGFIFGLSWLAAISGLAAFSLIKEPPGDVRDDGYTFAAHLQRAARLPRQNQNLRYLLIARVVILLSYVAAPFYSIYSIDVLGAPASIIGVYVGVRAVCALLINPLWSRLSDRRGNKIVMQLAVGVGVLMISWAIFAPEVARRLNVPATLIAYAIVPVFALMGVYETGLGIGAVNLTLEVAPLNDRAIYVGLTNTVLGVAYLSTAVSGLIVDLVGYAGVFALGLSLLVVASWALWRLRDPRELIVRRRTNVD